MFLYKDKLFQQHDGVSMESPLASAVANFFLSSLKNKLLRTQFEFDPKLYLRFIDDIFAIFDKDEKCSKFLDLMNTQHKILNLQWNVYSKLSFFLTLKLKLMLLVLKHRFIESQLILIYS